MKEIRNEYPRPQFQREEWEPLNGEWEFAFDDKDEGETKGYATGKVALDRTIIVPFAYQTEASGIEDVTHHEQVWYRRSFQVKNLQDKNVLLCFNGSDYQTDVYVNGYHATRHVGGFAPFSVDITKYLQSGENVLVVKCIDPLDNFNVRGKQSATGKRHGCWYIPTTGIWQSVWLEYFNKDYVESYSLLPDVENSRIYGEIKTGKGYADKLSLRVFFEGKEVAQEEYPLTGKVGEFSLALQDIRLWSTEEPNLYYVDVALYKGETRLDMAHTRIGLRSISVVGGKICLNGKPIYQKLILDQGYWRASSITPPSVQALKEDIQISKAMGFNGARKHEKFEDPYYYYFADELGFLTWCEMPSAYRYCEREVQNITREWLEILSVAKNFTSVITYVLLNESWGINNISADIRIQDFANSMYYLTRSVDNTRLLSVNDGWENISISDIYSIHDYAYDDTEFQKKYMQTDWNELIPAWKPFMTKGQKFDGKPIIFDEFGGIAMQVSTPKDGENWGYGESAKNNEEIYTRIENLLKGISEVTNFQGYCYTQLTDVEQEVNGLLDLDHRPKFDIQRLKKLFEK